jgi:hypothetical protein
VICPVVSAHSGADDNMIADAKTLFTNPSFKAISSILFLRFEFKTIIVILSSDFMCSKNAMIH